MSKEEIINIAWNIFPISVRDDDDTFIVLLHHFANLIAKREREECAKVCEDSVEYAGGTLAEAIRARGQE